MERFVEIGQKDPPIVNLLCTCCDLRNAKRQLCFISRVRPKELNYKMFTYSSSKMSFKKSNVFIFSNSNIANCTCCPMSSSCNEFFFSIAQQFCADTG